MVISKFNIGLAPKRNSNFQGRKHSEESKRKISETKKGTRLSKMNKNNISNSLKGKSKKPFTKQHLKNLSDSHKGKFKEKSSHWINGKSKTSCGYVLIYKPEHKFARTNGYILEHRWVMEKHIGRYLKKTEVVHHIDGDVKNNKINNLALFTSQYSHTKFHSILRRLGK